MKLRNKKTGRILEAEKILFGNGRIGDALEWNTYQPAVSSLAELNEDWEDYEPAEPLIKDEKIRKAVRAWAEALCLSEAYCASNGYEIYGGADDHIIQFPGEPFPFADNNKIYTIDELCGEEEE